ncbi:MAG: hypothetical protein ACR2L2_10820 [Acidobacteriota bacterium]
MWGQRGGFRAGNPAAEAQQPTRQDLGDLAAAVIRCELFRQVQWHVSSAAGAADETYAVLRERVQMRGGSIMAALP